MHPVTFYSSYSSEASDSGTGLSCGLSGSSGKSILDSENGKLEPSSQTCSPVNAFLDSLEGWHSLIQSNETCYTDWTGVSHQCDIPTHSMESSFAEVDVNHILGQGDNFYNSLLNGESENQLMHIGDDIDSEYASHSPTVENADVNFGSYGALDGNTIAEASQQGRQDITSATSFGYVIRGCRQISPILQLQLILLFVKSFQLTELSDAKGWNLKCQGGKYMPLNGECSSLVSGNFVIEDKSSIQPTKWAQPYMSSKKQALWVKGERNELITPYPNSSDIAGAEIYVDQKIGFSNPSKTYNQTRKQYLPHIQSSTTSGKQLDCIEGERDGKMIKLDYIGSHLSKVRTESIHSNILEKSHVEDDSDVCIIEDINQIVPSNRSILPGNSINTSPCLTYGDSLSHTVGGIKLKANDERNILRVALQDLSQPKSEVSPPDGLLAVPLLRHQRIALSWMVQKETAGSYCSGGILADDQGLGKTVSTIALILKERPPSIGSFQSVKKSEPETLNLDEDDDVTSCASKGRPAAGTLIVCPTSVLRQWADELHNKVTSKANLSVLVYHGSNRTKDPYELAKYDVVLTTYSIVSMEVPKQPLVDTDDDEKGSYEDRGVKPMGLPPSRKRKYPPSSGKKCKGLESGVLESVGRPLAKVAWFRVVLDEAQSIKNHRTQVARACWGLRAKRRWSQLTEVQQKDIGSCQAVLKTIMLRRTKGSLLDGEPIINLPPKSVELKKVDFSIEERNFYSRLEADSRAQFQEYADAGTVKQNYVNILLMLLRLRQACDHPLLVKRYDSNSLWRSSVEMAKTLPREKQNCLLNCLEASLAICGICNDPPEDAVVSMCGHVFCNQCICEHLTGDDSQCPTTNCKVRLNISHVFTKAALKSSLSDQAGCDSSSGCSGSEAIDAVDPCSKIQPSDSSKIKAALEVLHSLSKPQETIASNSLKPSIFGENSDCLGSSSDAHIGECPKHFSESQNLAVGRSSNDSTKITGEKAIVFSQWTRMLDLLEFCLKNSSIQYRRLDGTMSVVARDKAVKDFNTLPEVSVMIMSLKAASLGLNMVAACHVLLLDLWWNPTTEDQAIDRAHRIGQTRPVTVLRLTVRDTVEDRILALQQKKRKMVASAFGEDGTGGRQTRLTVEDLKYLFMM
ncbi:Helicase-like transcription factor CHR28 [Quillaja saponaria]|uniref:Helicase-like transcription factor CHR28 n=1 Tax=Quillaja saponaria TaxID=32244 RepID=A0AAD7M245_QUISA|nr:Helicase-like transcription factor CHR28 [Quillaja saponaria]